MNHRNFKDNLEKIWKEKIRLAIPAQQPEHYGKADDRKI